MVLDLEIPITTCSITLIYFKNISLLLGLNEEILILLDVGSDALLALILSNQAGIELFILVGHSLLAEKLFHAIPPIFTSIPLAARLTAA